MENNSEPPLPPYGENNETQETKFGMDLPGQVTSTWRTPSNQVNSSTDNTSLIKTITLKHVLFIYFLFTVLSHNGFGEFIHSPTIVMIVAIVFSIIAFFVNLYSLVVMFYNTSKCRVNKLLIVSGVAVLLQTICITVQKAGYKYGSGLADNWIFFVLSAITCLCYVYFGEALKLNDENSRIETTETAVSNDSFNTDRSKIDRDHFSRFISVFATIWWVISMGGFTRIKYYHVGLGGLYIIYLVPTIVGFIIQFFISMIFLNSKTKHGNKIKKKLFGENNDTKTSNWILVLELIVLIFSMYFVGLDCWGLSIGHHPWQSLGGLIYFAFDVILAVFIFIQFFGGHEYAQWEHQSPSCQGGGSGGGGGNYNQSWSSAAADQMRRNQTHQAHQNHMRHMASVNHHQHHHHHHHQPHHHHHR